MPLPALAVAAIPSAFSAISGLFQAGKGKKALKNLKRPEYKMPNAIGESTNIARRLANSNMAGYGMAQQNIGLSQANMIEASRQGAGGGLGNVATIQAGSNQAYQQLGAQNAEYNQAMQKNLQGALGQLANYQDREWQLNKFAPYKDAYNSAQGMVESGNKNFQSGLSGLSSLMTAKIQADSGTKMFGDGDAARSKQYSNLFKSGYGTRSAAGIGSAGFGSGVTSIGDSSLNIPNPFD